MAAALSPQIRADLFTRQVRIVAAGKAAVPMARVALRAAGERLVGGVVAAPGSGDDLQPRVEVITAGHPLPDEGSLAAGTRALSVARGARSSETLLVLLSGGASAMLALPIAGVTIDEKARATRVLLEAGADIQALNVVRKHLSRIKGGQLAAATRAAVATFALSDVVGSAASAGDGTSLGSEDDPTVIGSGPTVADPSTFGDAVEAVERLGVGPSLPPRVMEALEKGITGAIAETPKPGDPRLARSHFTVIGSRRTAAAAAGDAAERLGFTVHMLEAPVTGDARAAGVRHAAAVRQLARDRARPLCIISTGETTVRVRGHGRGGRNQEFALAFAIESEPVPSPFALASAGTDGVDGPTDAAGAVVDSATLTRAASANLRPPEEYLDANDSHAFFEPLDDLIRTGPTGTNVGDLQVLLLG